MAWHGGVSCAQCTACHVVTRADLQLPLQLLTFCAKLAETVGEVDVKDAQVGTPPRTTSCLLLLLFLIRLLLLALSPALAFSHSLCCTGILSELTAPPNAQGRTPLHCVVEKFASNAATHTMIWNTADLLVSLVQAWWETVCCCCCRAGGLDRHTLYLACPPVVWYFEGWLFTTEIHPETVRIRGT